MKGRGGRRDIREGGGGSWMSTEGERSGMRGKGGKQVKSEVAILTLHSSPSATDHVHVYMYMSHMHIHVYTCTECIYSSCAYTVHHYSCVYNSITSIDDRHNSS